MHRIAGILTLLPRLLLTLALVAVVACDSDSESPASAPETTRATRAPAAGCDAPSPTRAAEGPSAEMREIGTDGDVRVEAAVYPRPSYEGELWSHWGQGIVLPDGRHLSAIGDHAGEDGNSFLFVYDPATGELTRLTDVLSLVDHDEGDWGYGKIHAPMVAGPCEEIYVATYWGTRRELEFGDTYTGDLLLRVDPNSLDVEVLGVPVPERGIPSMAGDAGAGLLFGEAADPHKGEEGPEGTFFVYDVTSEEVVFATDDERQVGYRSIAVDPEGKVYLAGPDDRLLTWEPGRTELAEHDERLPGDMLRAATEPGPDGTVYGVTQDPAVFFALRPDGRIDELGEADEYTTSLALSPDGTRVYSVPAAHGDAWEDGTPLIALDTETGEQSVVVELNPMIEEELDLTAGGTYNVVITPDGRTVYVALNAGADRDDPWGEVVLVAVHLGTG